MQTTLFRPIGKAEYLLIKGMDYCGFPARLEWQPIFYPVLNQTYAEQIASDWNTGDEFSGYCGLVTKFDVNSEFLKKYDIKNVGGFTHNELWVPAEEMDLFNSNIVGQIKVVNAFFGEMYDDKSEIELTEYYKLYN